MPTETPKALVFKAIWNKKKATLDPYSVVTSGEVVSAIRSLKRRGSVKLSEKNPANFLKDVLRQKTRNATWHTVLKAEGVSARQVYGKGRVFAFRKFEGDLPFPVHKAFDEEGLPAPHIVETLSIPRAARRLATGENEAALLQIMADQNILARHFALTDHPELETLDARLLMHGMKGTPEIDALYLMTHGPEGDEHRSLVTLEAKGDAPILEDQVRHQIVRLAKLCREDPDYEALKVQSIVGVACRYGPKMGRNATTGDGDKRLVIFDLEPQSIANAYAYADKAYELKIKRRAGGASAMRFVPPIGKHGTPPEAEKP